jgi:hypothetical protein
MPVVNTIKMEHRSSLSSVLLEIIEYQGPIATSLTVEMASVAHFQTAVALSKLEEL